MSGRGLMRALWIGIAIQLVGRAIDGRWHLAHSEFETATDQFQAHTVLWIGVLVTLIASALAIRQRGSFWLLRRGWAAVLIASGAYVLAATWHFVEHAQGNDPAAAHVVLAVVWAALLVGAAATTIFWRRWQRSVSNR